MNNSECLGRPPGWTGGQVAWCNAPTVNGRRFCNRCQSVKVREHRQRVKELATQLDNARAELTALLLEGGE